MRRSGRTATRWAARGGRTQGGRLLRRLRGRDPDKFDLLAGRAAQTIGVAEERLRAEGIAGPTSGAAVPAGAARAAGPEEIIIELIAAHPEVADRVRQAAVVAEFEHPDWRARPSGCSPTRRPIADTPQSLPRELRDRVARRLLDEGDAEEREHMLADCIAAVHRRRLRRTRTRLLAELRAAEARGDGPAAAQVQRQLHEYLTEKPRT